MGIKAMRLLIIDDDEKLFALLSNYLSEEGFSSAHAPNGYEGLRQLGEHAWDAVILDIMLPGINGIEVLRRIRADAGLARTPVLLLTARGDEADKVAGLESGADDYLSKPFGVRELVARLRALLRRSGAVASGAERPDQLRVDELTVHVRTLQVSGPGLADGMVSITVPELRFLECMAAEPGRVVDRDRLYRHIFGHEAHVYDRGLDMLVSRLRKKLGARPDGGGRIRTVRGEGYLCLPPETRE